MFDEAGTEVVIDRKTVPNYPQGRKPYEGRGACFDWRGSEAGQLALCAMSFFVDMRKRMWQCLTDSSYAKYGIKEQIVYDFLLRAVPEVFVEYERVMGVPMPRDLPIKRIYMWFLEAKKTEQGCLKTLSREHPLRWATEEQLNEGLKRTQAAG